MTTMHTDPSSRSTTAPSSPSWPPADATIVAYAVSKNFRGGLVAVSEVSLAIRPGVTGLLGPNGAGKSTLMRLICGLAPPSVGKIWVAGGDPRTDKDVRGRIALVPQQDGVFERSKALDLVTLSATLNRVPNPKQAAITALQKVELDPQISRPLASFSKGMKQRVKIAQALVYDPSVIVLDEPLNGLDPRQRKQMIELFKELGNEGKTVLVSSHVLEEVEKFGSHMVVLSKGRLAAEGNYHDIRALMDNQPRKVKVLCEKANLVAASLLESKAISGCQVKSEQEFHITTNDPTAFRKEIARACQKQQATVREVVPLDEDLESVFRYLVEAGI